MSKSLDSFNCRRTLTAAGKEYVYYDLKEAEKNGLEGVSRLPFSMKVLLENMPTHRSPSSGRRQVVHGLRPSCANTFGLRAQSTRMRPLGEPLGEKGAARGLQSSNRSEEIGWGIKPTINA